MDCPIQGGDAAADLIVGFCAGTLDPASAVAFERHLEHCSSCSALVLAQRSVWQALDHLPPAGISADFDEQVFARIARFEALQASQPWMSWKWRHTLPVVAACIALVAAFLLRNPGPAPVPTAPPQQALEIKQVEHALDDMDMLKQMGFEHVGKTDATEPI